MFDRTILHNTKPLITFMARHIARLGLNADHITLLAFGFGLAASLIIALGHSWVALPLLLVGRLLDGVDGAVARLGTQTDRGAFLDIVLDFMFYASVPLAFATVDAVAAAILLTAFIGTGASFLAYAIIAAKRGQTSDTKSFYYLTGATEGAETILCFVLMCLWPAHFALFAYGFSALCLITIVTRIWSGWVDFGPEN
jgi:phosphatidylglycerophosphate synthase